MKSDFKNIFNNCLLVQIFVLYLQHYGKSGSWLYHKLDGVDGNKKPTEFSVEERYQLKGALVDLADRIRRAADSIE